ncbi:hypothetical protein [Blautia pseudococcoides]|uniref:Phage-related protein n=1 Tax=Blautia pseudococcoides TaxID=1796616 RepID=A0A1C7I451_9FIRM|nr:hypothetical protein [Blautia pseudococcoides]WAK79266.1 tail length tape measure protein [Blautia phage Montmirail]ANU74440.1 hypothetical protein A4V09_00795 [Blautia pseudococcoides]ASU31432.1 hypothetical protein ADH70_023170 [Blautia pseudococcoides]QJU15510.1 hypothetical protein HL650_14330 [Blautia pseudococcoides]QQQ91977.1 hypothetical protein I5Q86_16890 [Blautia pseudococcoides]
MEDGSIIIDSSIDTDGVKAGADNIKDILKSLVLSCDKLRASIDALSASMSEGFKSVGGGAKEATNGIKELENAEKKAKKQAEDLNDIHIERSGKGGYDPKVMEYVENYANKASSAIDNLKTKAEEYKRQLRELEEAGKYFDNSDEYNEVYIKLQDINGQIREYKKNLNDMAYGGKLTSLDNELDSLAKRTRTVAEETRYYELKLKQLASENLGFGDEEYDSVYQKLQKARAAEKEYKKSLNDTSNEQKRSTKTGKTLAVALGGLAKRVNKLTFHAFTLSKSLMLRGVRGAVNGVSAGFKKLTSILHRTNKESNKFGMGRMLGMSVMYSTVFKVLYGITTAIKEGLVSLSQYSDETNKSLSMLLSALTRLKNSVATAFAPLISAVAPILTKFINLLSQAITYVGMFIAALTGKNSFTRAKAVQQDFADTYGETAKNADKATNSINDQSDALKDAADEAEGYLSPIDEINKIQKKITDTSKNSGNDSGISTPDTGLKPEDMFETVPIDNAIQDFAKRLKDLIKSGDFEEIGRILGEKINGAVKKITDFIDWKNCGGVITNFINKFCDLFNSLVKTINWEAIGRMFGTGINTLVNTLYLLFTGIDWEDCGRALADGIYGIFDEIKWDKLGLTLAEGLNTVIKFLLGFANRMEKFETWKKIGKSLASGLMNAINNIEIENLGTALGKIIQGFIHLASNFVDGITFGTLGAKIGRSLTNMIHEIDLSEFAWTLATAITGIIKEIHNFIDEIDWDSLGNKIVDSLNTFFSTFGWEEVGTTISDAVIKLLDLLIKIVNDTRWDEFGENVAKMLESIDWGGILSRLWELIKGIFVKGLGGFLSGLETNTPGKIAATIAKIIMAIGIAGKVLGFIGDIAHALGSTQATGILGGAVTVLKKFLGGKDGIAGIFAKGGKIMTAITGGLGTVSTVLGNGIKAIGGALATTGPWGIIIVAAVAALIAVICNWDKVKKFFTEDLPNWWNSSVAPKFTAAKDWVVQKSTELKDGTIKQIDTLKTNIGEAFEVVKTSAQNKMAAAKEKVVSIASSMKSGAVEKISNLKESASTKWNELRDNTASKWQSIKASVSESAASLAKESKSKITELKSGIAEQWKQALSETNSKWKSMKESVTNGAKNMQSGAISPLKMIAQSFKSTFSSLVGIVTRPFQQIVSAASSLASRISSIINSIRYSFSSITSMGSGLSFSSYSYRPRSYTMPRLASGTVVPRRAGEFAAILGDNNKEAEVVSPLSTMKKAFKEAYREMGGNAGARTYNVKADVQRRTLFELVIDEAKMRRTQSGVNPFDLV